MSNEAPNYTHTVEFKDIENIKNVLLHKDYDVKNTLQGWLVALQENELAAAIKRMSEDNASISTIVRHIGDALAASEDKRRAIGTALNLSKLCDKYVKCIKRPNDDHQDGPTLKKSKPNPQPNPQQPSRVIDGFAFQEHFMMEPVPHITFSLILRYILSQGSRVSRLKAMEAQRALAQNLLTEAINSILGVDEDIVIAAMNKVGVKVPYLAGAQPAEPGSSGNGAQASQPPPKPEFKNDFSVLPREQKVNGGWVIGDLFYTDEEHKQQKHENDVQEAALAIKRIDQKAAAWDTDTARNLTYYIDNRTFQDQGFADRAAKYLEAAGKAWSNVCNVQFRQINNKRKALFQVRFDGSASNLLAYAFFPEYAKSKRVVTLYSGLETLGFDPVGVLRHELGHVLGFRHEHCRFLGVNMQKRYQEDTSKWIDVTPPDRRSVMNWYLPEQNVGTVDLKITLMDALGAQCIYPFDDMERFTRDG